jgi:hypothetical protein
VGGVDWIDPVQDGDMFHHRPTYDKLQCILQNKGADKYLSRPRRKQATATEDFDVHISYL